MKQASRFLHILLSGCAYERLAYIDWREETCLYKNSTVHRAGDEVLRSRRACPFPFGASR